MSYIGDVTVNDGIRTLTQIGSVQGNVFILKEPLVQPGDVVDETPRISVLVGSSRFGRKVRLRVSKDIAVGIFTEMVTDALSLPRSYRIEELDLDLIFRYAIVHSGQPLVADQTLGAAGIRNESEVELHIDLGWEDPITGEKSGGSGGAGGIRYLIEPDKHKY